MRELQKLKAISENGTIERTISELCLKWTGTTPPFVDS